jgi:hypothetical protein
MNLSSDSAVELALREIDQHRDRCRDQLSTMLELETKITGLSQAERSEACLQAVGCARDCAAAIMALLRIMEDSIQRLANSRPPAR